MLILTVIPAAHAVERHGQSAVEVRKCVQNGPTINFKSLRDPNVFFLVCHLPDGQWGVQVVTKIKKVLQEKSAYIMENRNWSQVMEKVLKDATRYNGPIP